MDLATRRLIGWSAMVAPALHTLTDVIEWTQLQTLGSALRNVGLIGMGWALALGTARPRAVD